MTTSITVLLALAVASWVTSFVVGNRDAELMLTLLGDIAYTAAVPLFFVTHAWVPGALAGAVSLYIWWRHWRKRRDRIKGVLGAKSRALRDALVSRMRRTAQPRPVLSPEGAR